MIINYFIGSVSYIFVNKIIQNDIEIQNMYNMFKITVFISKTLIMYKIAVIKKTINILSFFIAKILLLFFLDKLILNNENIIL